MSVSSYNRRQFLKNFGVCATALTIPGAARLAAGTKTKNTKRKPNVVLILLDDQGSIDLNCYGAKDLHTPNLDRLAKRGTRFTQFYVGAPVCSPSRAALLTGRYPQRAELVGNASSRRNHAGMPGRQITIAEVLKKAGYTTGHIGKWHLGYTPETMPNAQGFDYSFGHMGGCIDNYSHFFYWSGPNLHDLWRNGKEVWYEGQFFGDLMVNECNAFIEKHKDEPFFLYWAINQPHYPLQPKKKFREMYAEMDEPRRSYAAFVSTADEMIGQVIRKIDELGLREDTIIIYFSDHGHSVEERANYGGGDSGPYRGHKFTLWEGGIRVPAIVSWPGHFPQNAVRDQMVVSIDWLPTIAYYCGAKINHKIDGENISAVIESDKAASPHKTFFWDRGKDGHWAVRDGDWKLVKNGPATKDRGLDLPPAETFLSNLAEDVTETKNLADKYPEIVQRLTKLHEKWIAEASQQ